ncbi:efflux RND transporter periplasmic adaptor subunit [Kineobactrum sediminis]|nr:efflux RND transporter periplasmic adaptor subunit [Kineobactrum sediminis]
MKKLLVVAAAAILVGAISWPKIAPMMKEPATASPQQRGAPAVRTARVEPQPFEHILVFNGTLVAEQSISVHSELRGKVDSINFTDGQRVTAGDLIVTIESGELAAELRSLQEQLKLAITNARRLTNLFEQGSVNASARDDAVTQRSVLEADVERLQIRLAKTRISAPFAGTLGLRHISMGDLVEPDTLITTLQTITSLNVDFNVPERYRSLIVPGMPLSLQVAGHEEPFNAVVRAIDPQVDLATRTLTVRAHVENPDRTLLPGNYARVELVSRAEEAFVIPSVAVMQSLDAVSVFTVENGVAVRRTVKTGGRDSSHVEILQGLSRGAEIITSGVQSVREGQPVTIINAPDVS